MQKGEEGRTLYRIHACACIYTHPFLCLAQNSVPLGLLSLQPHLLHLVCKVLAMEGRTTGTNLLESRGELWSVSVQRLQHTSTVNEQNTSHI